MFASLNNSSCYLALWSQARFSESSNKSAKPSDFKHFICGMDFDVLNCALWRGEGRAAAILTPSPLTKTHIFKIRCKIKKSDKLTSNIIFSGFTYFTNCRIVACFCYYNNIVDSYSIQGESGLPYQMYSE